MYRKKCSKCLIEKSKKDYNKDKSKNDGLYSSCKQCRNKEQKDIRNTEKYKAYHIEYRKKYYQQNKNKINKKHRRYYQKNKKQEIKRNNINQKKRYAADPLFRTKRLLRCRIYQASKNIGFQKNKKTEELLGCSYLYFLQYLESKFVEGMTWENQGRWHIDHIIPLAAAKTQKEVEQLSHYTNLQPLWAIDNLKKNAKIPKHHLQNYN